MPLATCHSLATRHSGSHSPGTRHALTLVEMLIAMALTLLMMAAVVSVFANVSKSVANRRSAIEMTSQVRHVRNVLQRDLAGATCPGIPWQRTDSNHGYIEVIEGPQSDFDPSVYLQDRDNDGELDWPDEGNVFLDLTTSTLPGSNLATLPGKTTRVTNDIPGAVTDGGALGDWDDILMLTVRNEDQPFTGLVPGPQVISASATNPTAQSSFFDLNLWTSQSITSTLAEVVWYAVENPVEASGSETFTFGEPGFRTVYRRVLLIAPWLNYRFNVNGSITGPGVVRVLGPNLDNNSDGAFQALAALIAFQERYDLSVRLKWDETLGVPLGELNDANRLTAGRWTIVANSLADLTKRENRYEHHGYLNGVGRVFPFQAASSGAYNGNAPVQFFADPDAGGVNQARFQAQTTNGAVAVYSYNGGADSSPADANQPQYPARPLASVRQAPLNQQMATPRAILDQSGHVVHVTSGLVPLGGARRGQDVMLTDALAFDLRVYDPQAPVLAEINASDSARSAFFPGSAIEPGDAGWGSVVRDGGAKENPNDSAFAPFAPTILSRGAFVDVGYLRLHQNFMLANAALGWPSAGDPTQESKLRWIVNESPLADRPHLKSQMRTTNATFPAVLDAFRVYDTWSFHYENNGLSEDDDVVVRTNTGDFVRLGTAAELADLRDGDLTNDPVGVRELIDEGADGLNTPELNSTVSILSADDKEERETSPPYDVRLRGVQVILRAHEADSRQIREVKVHQTFVPK